MNVGELRHLMQLMQPKETRDAANDSIIEYQPFDEPVWCAIEPLMGRELFWAQSVRADLTHKVTMRYTAGPGPKWRGTYEDDLGVRTFEFGPPMNLQERRQWLVFTAIEVQNVRNGR